MLYLTKKMDNKKATQVRKQLSQLNEERFPKQKKKDLMMVLLGK